MTADQLADATYKSIVAKQGIWDRLTGKKPKIDSSEIADVMRPIATANSASMMVVARAVDLVIDRLS